MFAPTLLLTVALSTPIGAESPAVEAAKIPDGDNPWQPCDCIRDLPLDDAHGPYPVVVFVHGVEIYRDRAGEEWPRRAGQLQMTTGPLDLDVLLGELAAN